MDFPKCTVCGKSTKNNCNKCKSAWYCSAVCQKKDWALHKLLCANFTTFIETRPTTEIDSNEKLPPNVVSTTYKSAILFPENATIPQLIWIKSNIESTYEERFEKRPLTPNFHYYETLCSGLSKYMEMPSAHNDDDVEIWVGDNSLAECKANRCFATLNAGYFHGDVGGIFRPTHPILYAGNAIATRSITTQHEDPVVGKHEQTLYQDVTLGDLRRAFQFMARKNIIFEADKKNLFFLGDPGQWIDAVKISVSGDMYFDNKPKYRQVSIKSDHDIFTDKDTDVSHISELMGYPLLLRKSEYEDSWIDKVKKGMLLPHPFMNSEPCLLLRNMDVENKDGKWQSIDAEKWDHGMDSPVLVARKDKKDLTRYQVEALVTYVEVFIVPFFQEHDPDMSTRSTNNSITKNKREVVVAKFGSSTLFENFFENFKNMKLAAYRGNTDLSWANAVFFDRS
ncbi:uncharacterized protein PAC_19814 [Phialocephala subalpina]|uniref:MYND-type domain-containing protein n=1 Tax=Phialocephala subalpina TaxID=576137 RepID=A0A1L7XY36_9HELO|nr:uncharacterized protein PAC_19814 [Phialocephala subalpina]